MKRFLLVFLVLALLIPLASCSGGAANPAATTPDPAGTTVPDTTTTAPETSAPQSPELSISGPDYVVIRPSGCRNAVLSAAQRLYKYLSETSGTTVGIKEDWVKPEEDPDAVSNFEVLVGETNRRESGEVECKSGWYVGIRGDKVIILATREKYYDAAVDYFISQCRAGEDGSVKIMRNTEHYEYVEDAYAGVELTLRVGSYNIRHGADVGLNMAPIAEDILALKLDVVGFQEVDYLTERTGRLDTMKALSEASGYEYYAFAHAIDYQGGEYGSGILSRFPIESFEVIPLDGLGGEGRSVGHAVLNVNGVLIDFFNTHLDHQQAARRRAQIKQAAPHLAACEAYIITGDFNTADTSEFKFWEDSDYVNKNTYATFPSSGKGIDNIIFSPDWSVVEAGLGPEGHSDHRMLWAEMKFKRN